MGSTSHIAGSNGVLLESYRYDLNGKPQFFNASGSPIAASLYAVDLFAGERWIPELGLYDDRNRFMSPELGRFLQPDPIGFKGDGSNLYRYCGNDWANRTDPMGLDDHDKILQNKDGQVMDFVKKGFSTNYLKTFGVQRITFRAEHNEPNGVQVSGQVIGPKVDYKNAPEGKSDSPNAPTSLKILEKPREEYGTFTNYHLQAMHGDRPLTGDIAAKEHVTLEGKSEINFPYRLGTTNESFIHGRKGSFPDQVGLVKRAGGVAMSVKLPPNARANIWKHQTYEVWYEGLRYNVPGSFTQHTVANGQAVTNDLSASP